MNSQMKEMYRARYRKKDVELPHLLQIYHSPETCKCLSTPKSLLILSIWDFMVAPLRRHEGLHYCPLKINLALTFSPFLGD